ncbi:MAG: efflux RND transporter periplasmic adaptor subunit, partial [Acidaminococcaceae bacterium]
VVSGVRIYSNVSSARERALRASQGKAVAVPTAFAQRGTMKPVLEFAGNLEPLWQADLGAKIAGRIEQVLVEEGAYVEAGTVLALLDNNEIGATTNAARGSMYDAQASLEQAETTLARNQMLWSKGAVSAQELDNAKFMRDMAKGKLEAAQGTYENATSRMAGTQIITPQAGYVVKRYFQEGYYANVGVALFKVADISTLLAKINIPEGQISSVTVGSKAEITVPAMPGVKVLGRLTKIAAVADLPARTFVAEVAIPNAKGQLRGGLYANVQLETLEKTNVLTIPQTAIVMREDQRTVLVVGEDNSIQRKVLVTGYIGDGLVEVLSGIDETDRIVVGGQNKIREGSKVKINEDGSLQ